jgi:hypothetical protein
MWDVGGRAGATNAEASITAHRTRPSLRRSGGVAGHQGEELGLPEVDDLPGQVLRNPIWRRSGHRVRGRDGCRVPLPLDAAPRPRRPHQRPHQPRHPSSRHCGLAPQLALGDIEWLDRHGLIGAGRDRTLEVRRLHALLDGLVVQAIGHPPALPATELPAVLDRHLADPRPGPTPGPPQMTSTLVKQYKITDSGPLTGLGEVAYIVFSTDSTTSVHSAVMVRDGNAVFTFDYSNAYGLGQAPPGRTSRRLSPPPPATS